MNVRVDKTFERDIKKIKDKSVLAKVADTIEQVQASSTKEQIKNIKKLKGFHSYYRIRIGDYRVGLFVEETTVDFVRFLPRKDIYKYFP